MDIRFCPCALCKYYWIVFKFCLVHYVRIHWLCIMNWSYFLVGTWFVFYIYTHIINTNHYYMYLIVETHSVLYLLISKEIFYIHSGGSLEYQINAQIMIMMRIQFLQVVNALYCTGGFQHSEGDKNLQNNRNCLHSGTAWYSKRIKSSQCHVLWTHWDISHKSGISCTMLKYGFLQTETMTTSNQVREHFLGTLKKKKREQTIPDIFIVV